MTEKLPLVRIRVRVRVGVGSNLPGGSFPSTRQNVFNSRIKKIIIVFILKKVLPRFLFKIGSVRSRTLLSIFFQGVQGGIFFNIIHSARR